MIESAGEEWKVRNERDGKKVKGWWKAMIEGDKKRKKKEKREEKLKWRWRAQEKNAEET